MALLIVVNGVDTTLGELETGAALQQVVAALALAADRVAVERNGSIVPRRDWDGTPVAPGDRLEIVHFVGGGLPATG